MTWVADRLVERTSRNWLRLPVLRPGLGAVVDFLVHEVATGEVLLHGSNARTIDRFTPRDQTTYHGELVQAVFATSDPVWPLFFAVTDTVRVSSRWNACILPERSGAHSTRYFFSVGSPEPDFWTSGAVYLLPRAAFERSDEPAEWLATEPVTPLAVVPVTPTDFPFCDRFSGTWRASRSGTWSRVSSLTEFGQHADRSSHAHPVPGGDVVKFCTTSSRRPASSRPSTYSSCGGGCQPVEWSAYGGHLRVGDAGHRVAGLGHRCLAPACRRHRSAQLAARRRGAARRTLPDLRCPRVRAYDVRARGRVVGCRRRGGRSRRIRGRVGRGRRLLHGRPDLDRPRAHASRPGPCARADRSCDQRCPGGDVRAGGPRARRPVGGSRGAG